MGLLEKLYDKSPIFFQNIMVTTKGYQNNKKRYGKAYYEHREFLEKFDELNLDDKFKYQKEELIKFINYTNDRSKFYRNLYKGIDLSSIKDINDLKKLPIVDKEIIRSNIKEVQTVSKAEANESHTGGTTGKSLVVLMTPDDTMKRMAMLDNFKSRVGYEHLKMKRASFNGQHIVPPNQNKKVFWRYNKACKQMMYSSFHITEENMKYYVKGLNKFKPKALDGFPSCMVDIAGYIERNNIELEFQPIGIFPTAEAINQSGRQLLERVFKCKVYDQYASSEGAPFVTECSEQKLHIELASGVFEHYEKDSNEVLVTSFTTHGTPLIRYRIGDTMDIDKDENTCECGMESPIVNSIQGRSLDFLYTAKGAKINGGNVANLFKKIPNAIIRVQTFQSKMNEVIVKLEVDKKRYKPEYDNLLRNEFTATFGNDTHMIIEHVNEIPREKSGKLRMIINTVNDEEDTE